MDTPQPSGWILSEAGRSVLDFFAPQYSRLSFRNNESYLPDSNCCEKYPVSDGETFWNEKNTVNPGYLINVWQHGDHVKLTHSPLTLGRCLGDTVGRVKDASFWKEHTRVCWEGDECNSLHVQLEGLQPVATSCERLAAHFCKCTVTCIGKVMFYG